VHVTLRARAGLGCLRREEAFGALVRALARASKPWFRVNHFSVQSDHLHLIVEAEGAEGLVRGGQGLAVRCAKRLNRELGRQGAVWDHRYHARDLVTPREVRRAIAYVLLNFRKHTQAGPAIDPCSSGRWFNGWRGHIRPPARYEPWPVVPARTWLGRVGWRLGGGPIDPAESLAILKRQ
jgi:putative transposase